MIIPLAPDETAWRGLLPALSDLPENSEIILAYPAGEPAPEIDLSLSLHPLRLVAGTSGRAGQMNDAAQAAKGQYLWFLHADSQCETGTISALLHAIEKHPEALLYFDLVFLRDGSPLMAVNQCGVWLRSRLFKTPFGDQGFCLKAESFHALGGYPQDVAYGEDHILIWRARQKGIAITSTGARLHTSARKYKTQGWLYTTIQHQYLWLKQAWPEWIKLMKGKNR